MHRQLNPADKRILLIGAPHAKALAHQRANITGGLYSCEITTQPNDCDRIEIDNEVDLTVENKENQWMGVSVQSQGPGGKIVACAHRYQRRYFVNTSQESRGITGRCYMLSEDLSISSDEDGGLWKFCEGRSSGHERFGFCQQGLSATFTKDYHYAVFGAPGAYDWKGTVRIEQRNSTLLDLGYFDDGPYEVGDENRLDPELVPVPPNSYLGFSVDSGKSITKKGQLTIVSGAPRAKHSGAVVLLKKESEQSLMLSEEYFLEGPGLASSFGYDIAVVDLNGDGWQDIVVGAPQFFLKDGEVGGAVFVYINQEGKWDEVTPIPLYGPKDSMFGLSVENIGDINQDSYEAIAYSFKVDYERSKQGLPPRVTFQKNTKTEQGSQSTGTLELRGQKKRGCITAELRLQDDIQDKLRPIPIETSVSIQSTKRGKRQNSLPQLLPVLNSNQPSKVINKLLFRENGIPVISLSDQKDIALEITVNNKNGEDAHEAKLLGSFPSALSYSAFRSQRTTACSNEARCVEIKCPLQGLDSNAVIILRSRLWNSTFIEEYATLDYVNIIVKASLSIDASPQNKVLKNAEAQVRVTVFPEKTVVQHGRALWWIIPVGILAGFFMLALLVFLLWKCGFFKTAKEDQYVEACDKAENHGETSTAEAQT
ncbi:hypothetical protein AAFF_G00351020 [Aldrovandia affinis]|uniref:Integrin alpha-2 domain-containing protein n=1 Tax=Aldrovandia affinis TaxID=143900 RepID=A0AAD7SJ57_9TELE|nr:hypothetical protein AAFF_G00351020 [Aldrovandia affinis]